MKFLPLFSTILILVGCTERENKVESLQRICISTLRNSSDAISRLSDMNYSLLQSKLQVAIYGERIVRWNNKALKLKGLTNNILSQIDTLNAKGNFSFQHVLSLKDQYLNQVLNIDSTLEKVLKKYIDSFTANPDISLLPAVVVEKTKNDIVLLESEIAEYFTNQVGATIMNYTVFSSLVGQSSTHLKTGEVLEITAGIGSFSVASNPSFIINGKLIDPDENARAVYKLKVFGKGQKSVPVKIVYTTAEGLQESKEFTIDYFIDK